MGWCNKFWFSPSLCSSLFFPIPLFLGCRVVLAFCSLLAPCTHCFFPALGSATFIPGYQTLQTPTPKGNQLGPWGWVLDWLIVSLSWVMHHAEICPRDVPRLSAVTPRHGVPEGRTDTLRQGVRPALRCESSLFLLHLLSLTLEKIV